MIKNKMIGIIIVVALVVVAFLGFRLTQPAYAVTMDVNPSIEIISNRLNHVVAINPLNEDAKELLKDFRLMDRELKDTVEDLADLMVLKGYISGGKDNLVMITVSDNEVKQEVVDNLNKAIAANLENKQIEATIVNQAISKKMDDKTGRDSVARRISELDDDINVEQLSNMTLRELVDFAKTRNIEPEKLFSKILGNMETISSETELISEAKAREIALGLVNTTPTTKTQVIGEAKAKQIALGLVNGKIIEFELDDDDDNLEYEIEILANGYKYEIEMDAYTGNILEFDKDDDDFDDYHDFDDDQDDDDDDD